MLKQYIFQINVFSPQLSIHQNNSEIINQHIDNNQKCFLSSKSAYDDDFWRSCDTED